MTTDLSKYQAPKGTTNFEGFDKIRLDDEHVCELLQDYVLSAISWIEGRDLLVHKLTLSPEAIRAYPPVPAEGNGYIGPEFIEIKLPKGLYARAVDLSAGPHTPFQPASPPEEVKLLLGRLQQVAFPDKGSPTVGGKTIAAAPRHIVLNVNEFCEVLKWLPKRLDRTTDADILCTGFQGTLWEHETSRNVQWGSESKGPIPEPEGRSVKVWTHRGVALGRVFAALQVATPNWDFQRLPQYDLTAQYSSGAQVPHQTETGAPKPERSLPETSIVEWHASEGAVPGGQAKVTLRTPGGELLRVTMDTENFNVFKRAVDRKSRSF